MNILGLETSCDETAAAVVADGNLVRSNLISSQVKIHAAYGGVVPELAAREHLKAVDLMVKSALQASGLALEELDGIAVTSEPGLVPALLVGVAYAKGLALATGLPLVGVNHVLAHVYGAFLEDAGQLQDPQRYPLLALAVSGGHTMLLLVDAEGRARVVGRTLDDAAGEAFDKGAKILDLGYPGGPIIDRLAKTGNPQAVAFPRGLMPRAGSGVAPENIFNFSFSGIKTALLYHVKNRTLSDAELADVLASYQEAVVDVLVAKTLLAAEEFGAQTIVMAGGVACNSRLRAVMQAAAAREKRRVVIAPPKYCTDNAAMIAGLGFHELRAGRATGLAFSVSARLPEQLGKITFAPLYAESTD